MSEHTHVWLVVVTMADSTQERVLSAHSTSAAACAKAATLAEGLHGDEPLWSLVSVTRVTLEN